MQTTRTKKRIGAMATEQHAPAGRIDQPLHRPEPAAGGTGEGNGAEQYSVPVNITLQVSPINYFQYLRLMDDEERYQYPGEQNEIIESMLLILQLHPWWQDLDRWNHRTTALDVIEYLTGQICKLGATGMDIMLRPPYRYSKEVADQYYQVSFYKYYDHSTDYHCVPIGFLPFLREQNAPMWEAVMDMLVLMRDRRGVESFYGNVAPFGHEEMKEKIMEADSEGQDELVEELEQLREKYFVNGYPFYYMKWLKKRRATLKGFRRRLANVCPGDGLEMWLLQWLHRLAKHLQTPGNINALCFDDREDRDSFVPLMPTDYFNFRWSKIDELYHTEYEWMDMHMREGGVVPMCSWATWDVEQLRPFKRPEWPDEFAWLMMEAVELFDDLNFKFYGEWMLQNLTCNLSRRLR